MQSRATIKGYSAADVAFAKFGAVTREIQEGVWCASRIHAFQAFPKNDYKFKLYFKHFCLFTPMGLWVVGLV
jgi:hypothetical protein